MPKLRSLTLRYEGLFDFQGVYDKLTGFFLSRNYDYIEKVWKEKEGSPIGREITVKFGPEKKVGEYIKYKYKGEWKSIDVHDVDVIKNGQTIKLQHARFYINVQGEIDIDWQKMGKKHHKLAHFFNKHVMQREIDEEYAPQLLFESQRLLDEMKEFLNMEVTRLHKEAN